MLAKAVGVFEGIKVYESRYLGAGKQSSAVALPGYGILVGIGVFSESFDLDTVRHEFGHILQARKMGMVKFYILIGLPSLISAWTNWHKKGHQRYWTELWCNYLASRHFENNWDHSRFPAKDLKPSTKYWLLGLRF